MLIVTVIIMLILATISIAGIVGEDGILKTSREQEEKSRKEIEEQQKKANDIKEQYNQVMTNTGKKLEKVWTQTISGSGEDQITEVIETSDGGYVVVGYSTSTDTELFTNQGDADAFIVKYDTNGTKLWNKSLGGNKADWFSGIIENNSNEYIVIGNTLSDSITTTKGTINKGEGSVAGIVAKYDASGNEIFIKTEQNTAKAWEIQDNQYEYILFTDIAKTETGYAISGKLDYNDDPTNTCYLVLLEYANDGALQNHTKLWKGSNSGAVDTYSDYNVKQGTAGLIYETSKYLLFGNYCLSSTNESRVQRIGKDNKEELNISPSQSAGRTYQMASNVINSDGKIIINTHAYTVSNPTLKNGSICIYDESTQKKNWLENADYKGITRVGSTMFATLCTKDAGTKLQTYTIGGNMIAEYDIPDYENLYKVGLDESYLLTGNPTNETDVTKKEKTDAIISKYKLVDK